MSQKHARAKIAGRFAAAVVLVQAQVAQAGGPTGGTVVVGSATITNPSATQTVVDQTTSKALINWNSFSVPTGSSIIFDQPSTSSLTVNRVTGAGASVIDGELLANGNVWILNANGVLFGQGSQVNVGALLATTSDITNSDFTKGHYNLTKASPNTSAGVTNQGTLQAASGGYIVLSAPNVSNTGTIKANLGKVVMGGAAAFTVDMTGDNLLSYQISAPANGKGVGAAIVSNAGTIAANGGQVLMTARAAQSIQDNVINNTGHIEATSVSEKNGEIILDAGDGGTVNDSGTLDASGTAAGQTGGTVAVTGGTVNVTNGAVINASGDQGGGTIEVGGGSRGQGALADAQTTNVGNATISANANSGGNGGSVTIWSNGSTSVSASISAKGATGGTGGSVETSGHQLSIDGSSVNAGAGGQWLLDPEDLTVDSSAAMAINTSLQGGTSVTLTTTSGAASGPGNQTSGSGNITIDSTIPITWATGASFILDSYNNINIESAITLTGAGTLTLNAANAIAINAPISVSGAGNVVLDAATTGTPSQLEMSFGSGGYISYGATNNGGTLSINSTSYTLLYDMGNDATGLAGINADNASLSGNYALATSLDATSVSGWVPIGVNGSGAVQNFGGGFSGNFEGLGNTISNLTVNAGSNPNAGLFGYSSGTVRDVGLIGGSVSGGGNTGALVGTNSGNGLVYGAWETGSVTGTTNVGGLVGYNEASLGTIEDSYATGAVSGTSDVGGLAGNNAGIIDSSYASGTVGGASSIGGLAGYNTNTITNSDATGAVTGSGNDVGGLVGLNVLAGSISDSFASGNVSGAQDVGGLVGAEQGAVTNSYSMSYVTGSDYVGGLVGSVSSGGGVSDSFSVGLVVSSGANAGGLAGSTAPGTISGSYWDTQTSGQSTSAGGAGVTGETTSTLQTALPGSLLPSDWAIVAGVSFPYLTWQSPNGTPQVVSGHVLNGDGGTSVSGKTISVLVNGANDTLVSMGSGASASGGYYYALLAPGSISGGGSQVLAYGSGTVGAAFYDTATASISGLDIYANYLHEITASADYSTVETDLSTAIGGVSGAQTIVNGLGNLAIDASGTTFTIDSAIDEGSGTVVVTESAASTTLAINADVTAGTLELVSAGAITQGNSSVIKASNLTGSSGASTTLGGANLVGELDAFQSVGSFTLTNAGALDVEGTDIQSLGFTGVTAGYGTATGDLSLKTTIGNLILDGDLTAESGNAQTVSLISAGTITQGNSSIITADILSGSSSGTTSLADANVITALGDFNTGGGDLTLDNGALSVTGAVTAGSATVDLELGSGALDEDSGAGTITAGTLTGTTGGATLSGANKVTTLNNFTSSGGDFWLTDATALSITGTLDASGQTVTLVDTAAGIDAHAGEIEASILTGSTAGDANFSDTSNVITTLDAFQSTVGFVLADSQTLTVDGTDVSSLGFTGVTAGYGGTGGNLKLVTTSGDIVIDANLTAESGNSQIVTLISAGAITEGNSAIITADQLTGSSVNATTLNDANKVATLEAFQAGGDFSLKNAQALTVDGTDVSTLGFTGVTAGYGNTTGNLTLKTTTGDLTLDGDLTAESGNSQIVTLVSAGAITEGNSAIITADELTGSSVDATTLNDSNEVATLEAFQADGDFALKNAQALTVDGTDVSTLGFTGVTAGYGNTAGNLTLKTTTGDLVIDGDLTAESGNSQIVTLVSAGAISQGNSAIITADELTGSSVDATTLNDANMVATLEAFQAGGDFALKNAQTLDVEATDVSSLGFTGVTAGYGNTTGNLTLSTTNSGNLTLDGDLTAESGNSQIVTLHTAGLIDQTGGVITADELTVSAGGYVSLTESNLVTTLEAVQTPGYFSLTNDQSLEVDGIDVSTLGFTGVTAGYGNTAGNLTLTTTTGDLTLDADLTAKSGNSQIVTLVSAGAISQGNSAIITADELTGSSVDATTLNDANKVATLEAFQAGGDFALKNAQALTVDGTDVSTLGFTGVTAGYGNTTGNLTLTTTGDLTLDGDLTAESGNSQIVTLVSAGAITEGNSAIITADELTGSSVDATTLNDANEVATLEAFQAGGDFSLKNAQALTVDGTDVSTLGFTGVTAGYGNTTGNLTLTTTTGDLTLDGDLTAESGNSQIVTLVSAGAITEGNSAIITADELTGSSVDATTLNDANEVATLEAFQAGGDFSLKNAQALTVDGTDVSTLGFTGVTAGYGNTAGNLTLKTTSGGLTLDGDLTAESGNSQIVTLVSAGAITQGNSAIITADELTGSSVDATTLNDANKVATLEAFQAGDSFSLTNAQTLTVDGTDVSTLGFTGVTAGYGNTTGNLTLKTTTGGGLTLDTDLTASSGNSQIVTLVSAGAITQNGGIITADELTGSSVDDTTLNKANLVTTLESFQAGGNFSLTNAQALTVDGTDVSTLGFTGVTAGYGNTTGNLTLKTTNGGDLTLDGDLTAESGNTQIVTLVSAGAITEGSSAIITADELTGSSVDATTLNDANEVATLEAFQAGGDFALKNAEALTVDGTDVSTLGFTGVTAGYSNTTGNLTLKTTTGGITLDGDLTAESGNSQIVTLVSAGAITEGNSAIFMADELTGSSVDATTLNDSNKVATLESFQAGGSFSLTNAEALTIDGTDVSTLGFTGITAGYGNTSGDLTLKTTSGDITVASDLTAGTTTSTQSLTLTSAGAITLNGGTITSGTVTLTAQSGDIQQNGGTIDAGTLTGSATDGVSLTDSNQVGELDGFTSTGGAFTFTDSVALTIDGTLDATGQTLTLVDTGGGIDASAGVIKASILTGSTAGDANFSDTSNVIATLDAFQSTAGFSLADSETLTVDGTDVSTLGFTGVTAGYGTGVGNLTLKTTTGDIDLYSDLTADPVGGSQIVTLVSAGAITQGNSAIITADELTGSSVDATTLNDSNKVATLEAFQAGGDFALKNAQALTVDGTDVSTLGFTGVTAGYGNTTGNLTLTTTGDLTLDGDLTAESGNSQIVTLVSAGAITEGNSAIITADELTGSSVDATTLNDANEVATLEAFQAGGDFSLKNAQALTVDGTDVSTLGFTGVTAGYGNTTGNLTLTTTTGDLTLDGDLTAESGNSQIVTLVSAGAITEGNSAIITADELTGSSVDATTLNDANEVATLEAFQAGGDFSLKNAQALTVDGTDVSTLGFTGVTAGYGNTAGNLTLKTTSGGLTLDGDLTAESGNSQIVTLVSAGAITQGNSAIITADELTGSSVDATTLNDANKVATLEAFQAGDSFSLTNAQTLTVDGTDVSTLGFTGVTAGYGNTTGNLTLKTTTGGGLTLDTDLTASSGNSQIVTLVSAGAITQNGGIITADELTGSSVDDTTLNKANLVTTLESFQAGGNFSLTNAQALTVDGTDVSTLGFTGVTAGYGNTTGNLTLKTTNGGDLTLDGDLTAESGNTQIVTLVSAGAITEGSSAIITADELTGSSVDATTLNDANEVATLEAFQAGGDFALKNAEALTVDGTDVSTLGFTGVTAGYSNTTGNLTLKTTTGGITLDGDLTAESGNSQIVTLVSAGAITEGNSAIFMADELTGSSVDATTLNDSNKVATLESFQAGGSFSLTNAEALTIDGTDVSTLGFTGITAGYGNTSGDLTLKTTSGDITVASDLTAGTTTSTQSLTLTSAGAITLNGGTITSGTVTLTAQSGDIQQNGGTIDAGTLTGSATDGVSLTDSNQVGELDGFTSTGGAFTFTDSVALTIDGTLDATGQTLTLVDTGGGIDASAGVIKASILTGSTAGDANFSDTSNVIATLDAFQSTAGFSLADSETLTVDGTDVSTLGFTGVTAGYGTGVGNLTLKTTTGDIDLYSDLTADPVGGSQIVTLVSAGAITQGNSAIITADELTGSSVDATTLNDSNKVATLEAFQAGGDFALKNAQALTVDGTDVSTLGFTGVTAGYGNTTGNLTLTTTGDLTLDGDLTAESGNSQIVTLVSAGAITEGNSAIITADELTGSSVDATTLNDANEVATLEAFQAGGDFSLKNAQALTVDGTDVSTLGFTGVTAGYGNTTGNLTLTTTTGDLTLDGDLTAESGNSQIVTLVSAGAITEGNSAIITADELTGSSVDATTLNDANEVATLEAFQAGGDFSLKNAQALTVDGTDVSTLGFTGVTAGYGNTAGNLTLKTTSGGLTLDGDLTAESGNSQIVTLVSAGAITQGNSAIITADELTGSSVDATTLNDANKVATLEAFQAGDSFSLTNAQTLTVDGTDVSTLGFTGVTAGYGNTTGNLTLKTTTGGGLTLDTDLTASSGNSQIVTLVSAGAITQNGGIITADELTGSSVDDTTLNKANLVTTLESFQAGGNFSLTNAQALTVDGTDVSTLGFTGVTAGYGNTTGNLTLKTTNGGDLTLDGDLTAESGNTQIVTLVSAGAITEGSSAIITADELTGSSVDATTLNDANEVATLEAFQAGGDFALKNAEALTVDGTDVSTLGFTGVTAGYSNTTGNLTLKTTTGGITLDGDLTAESGNSQIVTLVSAGAITEGNSAIFMADELTGSSVDATTLNDSNKVATLESFQAGGSFALTDAEALDVEGVDVSSLGFTGVTAGYGNTTGNLTLTTTGSGSNQTLNANLTAESGNSQTVDLVSSGTITQGNSAIVTADVLTGSSAGSTTLNDANEIATLNGFANSAGSFSLNDAEALSITGTLNGTGQSVTLTDTAGIDAHAGVIDAATLTGSSGGAASFTDASNAIGTLAGFSNTAGDFALTDASALTITDTLDVTGYKVTLIDTNAGGITASAGVIDAATLTGSTSGPASFTDASNAIGTLNDFTNTSGAFSLTDNAALAITGTLNAAGQTVTLNDTNASGIDAHAGVIHASTLTGSTAGAALFTDASNEIGTLNNFINVSGAFSLTDNSALAITGLLNAAGQTVTLVDTNAGGIDAHAGIIDAATLTGSSSGTVLFTDGLNAITTLAGYTNTAGDFSLTDSVALTITGTLDPPTNTVTLVDTGGGIDASAAIIDAGTLTGSTMGIANFTNADNDIVALGNFTNASGAFSLTDSVALSITGALNATSQTATLVDSGGGIAENGGLIEAAILTGSATGSVSLTDANLVGTLDAFSTGSGFNLTDGEALTVGGEVNAGTGNLTLTTTGAATNDIDINADLIAGTSGGSQTVTLDSAGGVNQSGSPSAAIDAATLDVTASGGGISLISGGNTFSNATMTSDGSAAIYDTVALTLNGVSVAANTLTATDTSTGGITEGTGADDAITAGTIIVTTTGGDIVFTNPGNAIGSASLSATGNISFADTLALTIDGAVVGAGKTLTLTAYSLSQGTSTSNPDDAIIATNLVVTATGGNIALNNMANQIGTVTLLATSPTGGEAGETQGGSSGSDCTGNTQNCSNHSDNQSGQQNGYKPGENGGVPISASLTDSIGLTVASADVAGTLTLTDVGTGGITQTGAINTTALNVATSAGTGGDIVLTDEDNSFLFASVSTAGNASLVDNSGLTITGAHAGATLSLTDLAASNGEISQTGAISANSLVLKTVSTTEGGVAFTDPANQIANLDIVSIGKGDLDLYDTSSLVVSDPVVNGNVELLSKGNLTFVSSLQLSGGSIIAVAGWDGHSTDAVSLTTAGAYGNGGYGIVIGGAGASGDVAIGTNGGTMVLAGDNISLEAVNGYAQLGYHGAGGGGIAVAASGAVALDGGAQAGDYAQIGNGGYQVSGNLSGDIAIAAAGDVTLTGGAGQEAYAQIGNGGAESNTAANGYGETGAISVTGLNVALDGGAGPDSYAQIGQGGYDTGMSLAGGTVTLGGAILVGAVDGVSLQGKADGSYAQIGSGGNQLDSGAATGSKGTISGDVTVAVSDAPGGNAISMTAGAGDAAYVQIGNGGNAENTPATGATVNFSVTGNVIVADLALTGGDSGADSYAEVGDGDASKLGTANIDADVTIGGGTYFALTNGTAAGSGFLIGDATGTGSITETITGYFAGENAQTNGSIASTIQISPTNIGDIISDLGSSTTTTGTSGSTGSGGGSTPIEILSGGSGSEGSEPSDGLSQSLSDSLDPNSRKIALDYKTVIPGMLEQVVVVSTRSGEGIVPADEEYSSWGNEALWH